MEFKEQVELLVNNLESYGLNRRGIERELDLSDGYIDQQISKGGNKKIVNILKLLLKVKTLEKASSGNGSLAEITDLLETINANLIETRHGVELNQSLAKANLYQSAKLESLTTRVSHQKILERLNEVTAKIFQETFLSTSQNSEQISSVDS